MNELSLKSEFLYSEMNETTERYSKIHLYNRVIEKKKRINSFSVSVLQETEFRVLNFFQSRAQHRKLKKPSSNELNPSS